MWGLLNALLGVLGTALGLVVTAHSVERAGHVDPDLLGPGIRVALTPPLVGCSFAPVDAREELGWPRIDWIEAHHYDVLDPRGSFLGSVVLPPRSDIVLTRGTNVWVLERGAHDEPYVVRYAVEGFTEAP